MAKIQKYIVFLLIFITLICLLLIYRHMFWVDNSFQGFLSLDALRILGYYAEKYETYTGYWYSNSHLHPFYVFSYDYIYYGSSFVCFIFYILNFLTIYIFERKTSLKNGFISSIINFIVILLFIYIPIILSIYYQYDKTYTIFLPTLLSLIILIDLIIIEICIINRTVYLKKHKLENIYIKGDKIYERN